MSDESMVRFFDDLVKLVNYYRKEFEISYPEAIGVIYMILSDLTEESRSLNKETEDGEQVEEGDPQD